MKAIKFKSVNARPVKRFFVEMLTRDIALEDAILDLLDNCVDGVLRNLPENADSEKPYEGYWAKITFDDKHFSIKDNCGGIPWSLHGKAFRMGKPLEDNGNGDNNPLTVGVYGIGMKRAIFKIGREAVIWTKNRKHNYEVRIPEGWMSNENKWDLSVRPSKGTMEEDGTQITVTALEVRIRQRFEAESFQDDLLDKIQSHYAVILHKGFKVEVNTTTAIPKPLLFKFAVEETAETIRPYIFKTTADDVMVYVAVGLREAVPDADKVLDEQNDTPYSSSYAGWTVICNDRVVLYCNRDELTGWGTAKLPRYHNQFRAINGVVEFRGDPRKLPTTTTKRGLDFASPLYQNVLDRMRDGLRIFIDYTHWWKSRESEARAKVEAESVRSLSYHQLKRAATKLTYAKVKVGMLGEQYRPKLPRPAEDSPDVRISYFRDKTKVTGLAEKILPDFEELGEKDVRKRVGEASFDFALKQHSK